ncbi:hypothetical protein WJ96_07625 [Burkholderia ubonensis]|uniref:Uncharacterized protein n=1 Tax=Burkholderia ubonensis TaxID=101571 RepID=A0AAW3N312_9BURK|nr:hypothetical protein [Burkholderia ubonensis]KVP75569.1 hypothetical protein WJ93_09425 [Burkholderia ubonensis]KVP98381.1 hypothetical protein WJ96_07625 [Burkholderia ubonensis]KVZ93080.1 hypothetical protein WL25_19290 [Burkholderia ubonensis]
MIKSSDAELYRSAEAEAAKHGATFVGPAATYKYGLFRLADGREIEIHLYHVREGKWPRDIEQFLTRQATSRGRNRDKMLSRLHELAREGAARLLDAHWEGPHHWYSFEIPDGRVVKIRGSKLVTSGWPKDIDGYLQWSAARCQTDAEPKSKTELFKEFREEVERNNAVVLSPEWLGARMPHDVLLSDGTVRKLKPNQLKYFGWPAVPLDELRKMAAPYPVHILPDTADKETQVFRIMVNDGVYLEGGFVELKSQWAEGAPGLIFETTQWAEREGLRMAPTKWLGILADYEFIDEAGNSVSRKLPAADAYEARRLNDAELAKLRRVGTMHGAKLLSVTFVGKDAAYAWEKDDQVITASAHALIESSRQQAKFDTLKARVKDMGLDAELLSTHWTGMCAAYRWRLAGGSEVTAKLSQLRLLARKQADKTGAQVKATRSRSDEAKVFQTGAGDQALEVLRDWADGVGIKLLSTDWVDPGASYEWALPDGTVVAASLKKVRNCTRAVLRQRSFGDIEVLVEEAVLTKEECPTLLERISTSKSR